jgi:hypothetical protein
MKTQIVRLLILAFACMSLVARLLAIPGQATPAIGRSSHSENASRVRKESVTLSSPITGAACGPRVSAPGAAPRIVRELAGAGSILILNGYGCTYRAGPRDVTFESDQIRMRDDAIVDVDGEIIGRVARATLRREDKVPGSMTAPQRQRSDQRDRLRLQRTSGISSSSFPQTACGVGTDISDGQTPTKPFSRSRRSRPGSGSV